MGSPIGPSQATLVYMFFSFDGIDGVGKSTQFDRFCQWLTDQGHRVVTCRDPGSTPLGESLRDLLLHSGPDRPIGSRAEMLMYMAARAQLVEEIIRPAMDDGAVVVSDRYLLANLAYQAHAGGLDRELVADVGKIAVNGVMPNRVFLLDLDPKEAAERRGRPADRMEMRGLEYQTRLRSGFLEEAKRTPEEIRVIDANQSIESIEQEIQSIASEIL